MGDVYKTRRTTFTQNTSSASRSRSPGIRACFVLTLCIVFLLVDQQYANKKPVCKRLCVFFLCASDAASMSLFVTLSVLWYAATVSSRIVCRRSNDLRFRCGRADDLENSTGNSITGSTRLSVVRKYDPGSAYVVCICPKTANSRFTVSWSVDGRWIAKMDGADGDLIEESLDIREGWYAHVKIHRGVLYLKNLNESTEYCLQCRCVSETRHFFSNTQCVRLLDLRIGSVPHKRDWRFSVVATCFAVASAFVVAGILLSHLGIRDDVLDPGTLELIRNPISALNLTVIQHDLPDSDLLDAPPSSPAVERRHDTGHSRRYTIGCRDSDMPMGSAFRHSV